MNEAAETLEQAQNDLIVAPAVLPVWAPSVAEVAALIPRRVKQRGGFTGSTFTSATEPTGAQVETLIGLAVARVASAVTWNPCTARTASDAQAVTTLFAAMLVEQSFWPEQTQAAGSTFQNLLKLWEGQLPDVKAAIAEKCRGGEEGEEEEQPGHALARGGFDDGIPLIGRDYPPAW